MILKVDFAENPQAMDMALAEQSAEVDVQFGQIVEVKSDADPYTGDYSVTPSVAGKTLPTKDKYMWEDVTVEPIPVYNVSNTSGGTTVYIAKEI